MALEDPIMMGKSEWQLLEYVRNNQHTIANAMRVYADKMDESGAAAQQAHEAGQSNGLITNQGYEHVAGMARESAAKAREVAGEILSLLDKIDEEDND